VQATLPSKSPIFSTNCHIFEPPNPVNKFYYKCDRHFHLDDLLELYNIYDTYAIVLISGKRTDMYVHSSNNTQLIKSLQFELPSQHKTGGSSAARMGRIRDEKINLSIRKTAETMISLYVKDNVFQHIGLILAGPASIKEKIQSEKIFVQHFNKYLLRTITIAEIEDNSIYYVVASIMDISSGLCMSGDVVAKFETMISDPEIIDLIVFGTSDVLDEYNAGNLAELFIDKDMLDIITINPKTIVQVIQNSEFINKYGSLVGIKYFAVDE